MSERFAELSYNVEPLTAGKAAVARAILEALPEWFGRPEAREDYIAAAEALPTMVARDAAGAAVGFISIERHTPVAAEVHVMGVLRDHHGRGCGREMIDAASAWLEADDVRWLTVKTLGPAHPDVRYAATRRFYERMGFEPLEVFTALWGEDTPCLYMLKPLAAQQRLVQTT